MGQRHQGRVHPRRNSLGSIGVRKPFTDRQQLDRALQGARRLEVVGTDLRDALAVYVVGTDPGVEGDRRENSGLGRSVVALDIGGRIGLGVSELPCLGKCGVITGTCGVHGRQDVVGGAVDDAGHPNHRIASQRLGQGPDDGNGAGHGRLEIEVNPCLLGSFGELTGRLGQKRLVGGHHRLARIECTQNAAPCGFHRTHELDDDVDVVSRNQRVDIVGEQLDRDTAVIGHTAHTDTANLQRRTDAGGEVTRAALDDPRYFAADVAQAQDRYAYRVTHSLTSKLTKSSTVSRRRISRALPSLTAITAGRVSRLYRLDIE